jgi:uncharacterized membrane protein YtjA (UPF0391 family)
MKDGGIHHACFKDRRIPPRFFSGTIVLDCSCPSHPEVCQTGLSPRPIGILGSRDVLSARANQKIFPHARRVEQESTMLRYAIIFLVIALLASVFGMFGLSGFAMEAARILFFVFLVLLIISLITGRRSVGV